MKQEHGVVELKKAMGTCRWHFINVGIFSIFVNLLMLTGPRGQGLSDLVLGSVAINRRAAT